MNIFSLPDELIVKTLRNLSVRDVHYNVRRTSKHFERIIKSYFKEVQKAQHILSKEKSQDEFKRMQRQVVLRVDKLVCLEIIDITDNIFPNLLQLLDHQSDCLKELILAGPLDYGDTETTAKNPKWPLVKSKILKFSTLETLDVGMLGVGYRKTPATCDWSGEDLVSLFTNNPKLQSVTLNVLSQSSRNFILHRHNSGNMKKKLTKFHAAEWKCYGLTNQPSLVRWKNLRSFCFLTDVSTTGGGLDFHFWSGITKLKHLKAVQLYNFLLSDAITFNAWYQGQCILKKFSGNKVTLGIETLQIHTQDVRFSWRNTKLMHFFWQFMSQVFHLFLSQSIILHSAHLDTHTLGS